MITNPKVYDTVFLMHNNKIQEAEIYSVIDTKESNSYTSVNHSVRTGITYRDENGVQYKSCVPDSLFETKEEVVQSLLIEEDK